MSGLEFYAVFGLSAYMALAGYIPGKFWPKVGITLAVYTLIGIVGCGLLASNGDFSYLPVAARIDIIQFPIVVFLVSVGIFQTIDLDRAISKEDGINEGTGVWHAAYFIWALILCPLTLACMIVGHFHWLIIVSVMVVIGALIVWHWSTLLDEDRKEVIVSTSVLAFAVLLMAGLLIFHNRILG